jgi:CheY-like chemotaxis protein
MLRVVYVEDNPGEAFLLEKALSGSGTPVEIVRLEDGVQALEYLSLDNACDLVLLDLNLPLLSGFEVLEQLRNRNDEKMIPIIVLSGSGDSGDVERCYRAGANSYIRKPLHLEEIFTMVNDLVAYWSKWVTLPSRCRIVGASGFCPGTQPLKP